MSTLKSQGRTFTTAERRKGAHKRWAGISKAERRAIMQHVTAARVAVYEAGRQALAGKKKSQAAR